MIHPTLDLTGQSKAELDTQNQQAIIEELARQKDQFTILGSMQIAESGDAHNATDFINTFPFTLARVDHGLGYVPLFLVFMETGTNALGGIAYSALPFVESGFDAGSTVPTTVRKTALIIDATADIQSLYITLRKGYASGVTSPFGTDWLFRYYIFAQPNS